MLIRDVPSTVYKSLDELNSRVISCELCSRLRRYSQTVAHNKRRQFAHWTYWGRPLPGFGDPSARVLILGLAPAAHGGNRTGRMFTGDGSAQFLMSALYRFNYANQPTSTSVNDGLKLQDAYMTAIVRCAPPKNKPSPNEIAKCERYWTQELTFLKNIRVMLALGRVAFDTYVRYLREHGVNTKKLHFSHGALYKVPGGPVLCASYHPSRQNTQTGKLTVKMFDVVFLNIQKVLEQNIL